MDKEWKNLYKIALSAVNPYEVSENMYIGTVGAAVLTKKGNVYTGVCIDMSCSLGMCAERNALGTMLVNREYEVVKVCAVYKDGTVMPPCGACRGFMMELGKEAKEIEVLINNEGKTVKLGELIPEYPY